MNEQEWWKELNSRYRKSMEDDGILSKKEIEEAVIDGDWDYAEPHEIFDQILCEIIEKELGFHELSERFKKLKKWYA